MRRLFALSKAALVAVIALVLGFVAFAPQASATVYTSTAYLGTYECYQGTPTFGSVVDNKGSTDLVVTFTDGGASVAGYTAPASIFIGRDVVLLSTHLVGSTQTVVMYVDGVQVDSMTYNVAAGCGVTPLPKDSTADVAVTSPTCAGNGVATVTGLNNATLVGTLDQSVGTHEATFKSTTGHLFANGTDTFKKSYTIGAQLTGEQCSTPLPKDSTADVAVTSPTCAGNGVATVTGLNNATLVGTLDQSVGTHEATFKSTTGHLFANGTDTFKKSYTIGAQLTGEQCSTPLPKDSTADVAVTSPTCAGNGVATVTGLNNATLVGTLDQSVGTHEATFKSTTGHLFANGTDTFKKSYTIGAQLTGEQCSTPLPKDSTADVAVTSPTCAGNGVATVTGLNNATLVGTLDQSVGTHEATFKSTTGHLFANGTDTFKKSYTIGAQLTGEQCSTPLPKSTTSRGVAANTDGEAGGVPIGGAIATLVVGLGAAWLRRPRGRTQA